MLPDTQEMLKNVWRIEINPCPPSRAASWRLTVRGQGVSAVSWEGEEEEEEEEGVSEPGAGREADSEFPGPQLLPVLPPHPPVPTTCATHLDPARPARPAGSSGTHQPLQDSGTSVQTCSHPGSSDGRWGSLCCKPSLASGYTPRWSEGAGGGQVRHPLPTMPVTSSPPSAYLHTSASHKLHLSILGVPLNPDQHLNTTSQFY